MQISIASLRRQTLEEVLEDLETLKADSVECIASETFLKYFTENYKVECLGSLFRQLPNSEEDLLNQFRKTCELANKFDIKKLMFGSKFIRDKFKMKEIYPKMFKIAKDFNLILLVEAIKDTFPSNHKELLELQLENNVPYLHVCLVNALKNKEKLDSIDTNMVLNCHTNLECNEIYKDFIKKLKIETTMEF